MTRPNGTTQPPAPAYGISALRSWWFMKWWGVAALLALISAYSSVYVFWRAFVYYLFILEGIWLAAFLACEYLFFRQDLEHERNRKAGLLWICFQSLRDIGKLPRGQKRDE